ncbi:helix-turn-helix domain-containing protein [Plantactinospora solaniradicis]|uniref:Helix-turn-helix domain-containing protein n=1 Tax=Plantactinospora solaniradicis TaxID=1723736 RepID=A0ABW1KT49_9ACTN
MSVFYVGGIGMICLDAQSDDLRVVDRLEWWRERTRRSIWPSTITCEDADRFHAAARSVNLGSIVVSRLTYSSSSWSRSERQVRQSDPEQFVLALNVRGQLGLSVADKQQVIDPREFNLLDTSRACHGWTSEEPGRRATQILVQVPRSLMPLRSNAIDLLIAERIPGTTGIGEVVGTYLLELIQQAPRYRPDDAVRLSAVTLDLVTALLAHHLDGVAGLPSDHREALYARVLHFIERHIGDPQLSPRMIATAHGVSLRYLQKLFKEQGVTIAGRVRQRRLDRCRAALADPHQWSYPIHKIAQRNGFSSNAHFSHLFSATYGLSPSDYRRSLQP